MKKILIGVLAALSLTAGVSAQTFTVANADGVDINYSVVSAAEQRVNLSTGTYSGHVVVPATVVWHDTTWTVCGMANNVFMSSAVTYVHLPATITTLSRFSFRGCTQLDSLRFDAEAPMALSGGFNMVFGADFHFASLPVYVPCGHLAAWKASDDWRRFGMLTSDCAYKLDVIPSMDSVVRVDSILMNNMLLYSSGRFEAGDTAVLRAIPFSWKGDYNMIYYGRRGFFLGWSDGSTLSVHSYVMPAHNDTVICYVDTMHYAVLSASRIVTPVYQFGNLSYDGQMANYTFQDIPNASTVFASSLWVGSGEHVAAVRFMNDGYDYFPGPLRTTDATTDMENAMRYSRVWHVTREMIDYHIAHCGEAGYEIPDDILTWPGNGDSTDGFAGQLAPYYDADGNGHYLAAAGDYPLIRGDECVFSIFNDQGLHTESNGQPLGIEVHAMTYAFNEPKDSALWNTVFVHYDVYNRSSAIYNDTYFGAWTDFDIGYAWDDFVGCDVKHGMYYGYNGAQNDSPGEGSFTGVPPAQSCMILAGGLLEADGRDNLKVDIDRILSDGYTNQQVKNLLAQYLRPDGTYDTAAITRDAELFYAYDPNSWYFNPGNDAGNFAINGMGFGDGIADNERLGMTNFTYYDNSTNAICGEPMQASDFYNYMRGYWKNGQHIKYGGNGVSSGTDVIDCNYMFPGSTDPWNWGTDGVVPSIDAYNWYELTAGNTPGDRRGIGASGPFTLAAGSRQQFDVAYVTGFGSTDSWASVEVLNILGNSVRSQFMRDTTDSGRPFVYMPYSAPHEVAVDEVLADRWLVYPNPTTGMLHVNLSQASEVRLYDMMGRCLMAVKATEGSTTIDLRSLPQGIYLLRANGHVQRVVKR